MVDLKYPLMSGIKRLYCFISTSYLAGLLDIFMFFFTFDRVECVLVTLLMRTLCDAYHKKFGSH